MQPKSFDGVTFNEARDGTRLKSQMERVREMMQSGIWYKLSHLVMWCGGTEASISARIRDLRKPRFGGHTISRRHIAGGTWEYRMEVAR